MKFTRTTPCEHCPFRVDVPGYLHRVRAVEIAQHLMDDGEFPCHKTVTHDEDEDGEYAVTTGREVACAGAMIAQNAAVGPGQMARVAERLGLADMTPFEVDPHDVGVLTLYEFADHHESRDDDPDMEFCNVVGDDCENPAGFAVGGGAIENEDGPQCDWCCPACGEPTCDACRDGDVCLYCAEDDDARGWGT